jgi:hypothetical protein
LIRWLKNKTENPPARNYHHKTNFSSDKVMRKKNLNLHNEKHFARKLPLKPSSEQGWRARSWAPLSTREATSDGKSHRQRTRPSKKTSPQAREPDLFAPPKLELTTKIDS